MLFKVYTAMLCLLAASTAVAATPGGGNQCGSDTDCAKGYSCCRAVPYPKCFKLPAGAVC